MSTIDDAGRGPARGAGGTTAASFRDLYTPKLVTVLREGYGGKQLRADLVAGLTVAIVALPLSMGIAIASGVSPDRGLYTAIVGGFLVSLLGGSRFQIGGPAGAFIVLVAATVARHGVDGLLLATFLSGLFMLVVGYARLGAYIKFIPYPVTVGFTAGIAVIIFTSQLHDLFGLTLAVPEPGDLLPKLLALGEAAGTASPAAAAVAALTVGIVVALKHLRPGWPGMLIAVVAASAVSALFALPVETIGTRFGGIPRALPLPTLPALTLANIQAVLSAVVADGITGRRHRSNCELVAQGFANIGSSVFGGIPVTGTIARTATNVRAGAHGPVSGMLHALFLLAFMLVAAPLASYIPLAALAAMLAVVAWNMVEKTAIGALLRSSRGDALVLAVTFLLVIFRDLTEAIVVGFALGAVLFIDRMSKAIAVEAHAPAISEDRADAANGDRVAYDAAVASNPEVVVYRISGAFFFGAAATVSAVLDRIADRHKAFVLDCSAVPFLDSTAANVIEGAARKARRAGVRVFVAGAAPQVRRMLFAHGVRPPLARYKATVRGALEQLHRDDPPPFRGEGDHA
jgi:sulfate permease, SulP family